MAVDEAARSKIESFRRRFREKYAGDARFLGIEDADREDGSALATRFRVADHLWLEVCLRPHIPQLRAGIVTDDQRRRVERISVWIRLHRLLTRPLLYLRRRTLERLAKSESVQVAGSSSK